MSFNNFYQRWKPKIDVIVKGRGARLNWPDLKRTVNNGTTTYATVDPLLIWNAPTKGSSGPGRLTKQAIFVGASFDFSNIGGVDVLTKGKCHLAIYRISQKDDAFEAKLFDQIHFDMENGRGQTEFHPIFHIQRGSENIEDSPKYHQMLAEAARTTLEKIAIDNATPAASPYLRLPSPQMDFFAVMTMIMADFFCNHKQYSSSEASFKALLKLLKEDANIARQGESAAILRQRQQEATFDSLAHWYAESA